MNRIRDMVQSIDTKESFLTLYRRNIAVAEEWERNAARMRGILTQMRLGAIDKGWEITDEDLGR